MALSDAERERFQDVTDVVLRNRDRLSQWETGFMFGDGTEDNLGLIPVFVEGGDINISARMWTFVERIFNKVK